jgi:O-antigen ligase
MKLTEDKIVLLEKIFIGFALFVFAGTYFGFSGVLGLKYYSQSEFPNEIVDKGDVAISVIHLSIYIFLFFLILLRKDKLKKIINYGLKDKFFICLLALAFFSSLWSQVPVSTFRTAASLIGSFVLGIYIAASYKLKEILKLFAAVLVIIALLSIAFIFIYPEISIMHGPNSVEGAWRGIVSHKNAFGALTSLGALLFFIAGLSNKKFGKILFCAALFFVFLLLKSNSKTFLLVLIGTIILFPVFLSIRNLKPLNLAFIIFIIYLLAMSSFLLLINLGAVTGYIGKDITLTGRTGLWALSLESFYKKPILGYGYNSFWLGYSSVEVASISDALGGYMPVSAHNGYIDLILNLGILGGILFALSFIGNVFYSLKFMRMEKDRTSMLPLAYLLFFFVSSISESYALLIANNIFFVLYVAISFNIRGMIKNHQRDKK